MDAGFLAEFQLTPKILFKLMILSCPSDGQNIRYCIDKVNIIIKIRWVLYSMLQKLLGFYAYGVSHLRRRKGRQLKSQLPTLGLSVFWLVKCQG